MRSREGKCSLGLEEELFVSLQTYIVYIGEIAYCVSEAK